MRKWEAEETNIDVLLIKRPVSPERWEMQSLVKKMMEHEDQLL
jgi:hypothetical protein